MTEMKAHEFQLYSAEDRDFWEDLLGITILYGDRVRIPHDRYVEHAREIEAHQMMAALRASRRKRDD